MTRHARNECRLYKIDPGDVEVVVSRPKKVGRDKDGKAIYEGAVRGRVMRVVVALDEPDLIVTIYPRRK